jgi:membrane protein required for beta-lactamase induction
MLTIIIILTLEYFYDDIKEFRRDEIVLKSYHLFEKSLGKNSYVINRIHLIFVIFVLLMGMIILTISSYISSLLYFMITLIMLSYTLRTNQYNKDIEELKIKLEFKKDHIDKDLLFNICPNLKQTRVKTNLNSLIINNLFFNSIRNTFSILFLFLLLGAPAAIAYKVLDCMIYSNEFKVTAKVKQELKNFLYYLDYIPIRLTSYTFSVVSNYDQVINKINNLKLSNNQYISNIEFINQTGSSVYDETAKESDQILQIQNILARTLIAWLGIIVLLAVTGIFF